jgi:four helix bundle protein
MENNIKSFEDLECWKLGREARMKISELTKKFPREEAYGLTQHIKKTARSITDNIAEGYGRFHFQENIQFCRISRGSAYEAASQLIEANDAVPAGRQEDYIANKELEETRELINKFLKVLNGYINYLNRAISNHKNQNTNNA